MCNCFVVSDPATLANCQCSCPQFSLCAQCSLPLTLRLGLSKPNRDPTHPEDPTGTDPKPVDPIIPVVGGGFSPHRNRLRQEPPIPARNPDSGEKNSRIQRKKPRSRPKNPDSGDISCRSGEILIGSGEISSNPMRLPPDLAKSHRFR